jgi:hypothetical protein
LGSVCAAADVLLTLAAAPDVGVATETLTPPQADVSKDVRTDRTIEFVRRCVNFLDMVGFGMPGYRRDFGSQ